MRVSKEWHLSPFFYLVSLTYPNFQKCLWTDGGVTTCLIVQELGCPHPLICMFQTEVLSIWISEDECMAWLAGWSSEVMKDLILRSWWKHNGPSSHRLTEVNRLLTKAMAGQKRNHGSIMGLDGVRERTSIGGDFYSRWEVIMILQKKNELYFSRL